VPMGVITHQVPDVYVTGSLTKDLISN
jgi:hypothetical protein